MRRAFNVAGESLCEPAFSNVSDVGEKDIDVLQLLGGCPISRTCLGNLDGAKFVDGLADARPEAGTEQVYLEGVIV